MKKGCFTSLLTPVLSALFSASAAAQVAVEIGHINQAPPGTDVTAAYFSLSNPLDRPVTLNVVRCEHPAISRCEIHQTLQHGDRVHMQAATLQLAPYETKTLQAHGWHLMLWLNAPISAVDQVRVVLSFDSGQELAFTLPVQAPDHHHHHENH